MAAKYESIVIWLINCFIDKKINFQASWFLFGVEYHRINHWMEKLKDFLTYRIGPLEFISCTESQISWMRNGYSIHPLEWLLFYKHITTKEIVPEMHKKLGHWFSRYKIRNICIIRKALDNWE